MNLVLVTVQHPRVFICLYLYLFAAGNTYKLIAKKNIAENKEIRLTNEGKVSNDTLSGPEELMRP